MNNRTAWAAVMAAVSLLTGSVRAQQHPRDAAIHDADTKAWWHTTEALSGDSMEGRDTGSAAHRRAAEYVEQRFRAAGLKPAGENGGYLQEVPLHEVAVDRSGTSFAVIAKDGSRRPLAFLENISVSATASLPPALAAPLAFRGYCSAREMGDVKGKAVVCFNTRNPKLPGTRDRVEAAKAGGAVAVIQVDDPYFSLEPPRWPEAYARSVRMASAEGGNGGGPVMMRLRAGALALLLAGSGRNADAILKAGGQGQPLPAFDLATKLDAHFRTRQKDYRSPNVLAVLPGTDPALKDQYVVIAAHLDGYGYGEPVEGDRLYNGTLDDAAYVALLIQFAENQHGKGLRRSVLFCAFTGEEKGLLGSTWFTKHPTVPARSLVADINLDQLRPLFPLHILTTLAVNESTLGETVRQVATPMGIEIREDREPQRRLLQRADHWPFMQIGVPAVGFVFGFDPGTDAERRYREWYRVRYHRPQDDLTQPVNFDAAAQFDRFFYALVKQVANADAPPQWLPGSAYAQKRPAGL